MKRTTFISGVLAVSLSISLSLPSILAQEGRDLSEAAAAFEKFVEERIGRDRIPGLSAGFMKDDFTWARGFGLADLENKVPAIAESSFRLASLTKTLTAVSILQLAEAGKLKLDSAVQTYVPDFPKKKWPVTVRQLLGHLGGISHYKNYAVEGRIREPKTTKEAIAIFRDFDLVAEPGTRYVYSSYGYNLLGAVIEAASGMSYESYLRQRIFEPLAMDHSRLDNPLDIIPHRVRGYQTVNGQIKNSDYVDISSRFSSGGTRSTVFDLLKFARGLLSHRLLKPETMREMFTSMALPNGTFTGYGLGWNVQPWKGHYQVSHGGSQPETRTYLLIFPTEQFAAAVAANLEEANLTPYITRLTELVLGEDLHTTAYAPDRVHQLMSEACGQVYSYGVSAYDWNGGPLAADGKELEDAFSYFLDHVNEKALTRNFKEEKKKISEGIHPASRQAFTRVGSFMAASLSEAGGGEVLIRYRRDGWPNFFADYIALTYEKAQFNQKLRFPDEFAGQISRWKKDWSMTYTDFVRSLTLTPDSECEAVGAQLKGIFGQASLYPDLGPEIAALVQEFLKNNELAKAMGFLKVNCDLYPGSPAPYVALASAYIWSGNFEPCRELLQKARGLDDTHPMVGVNHFYEFGQRLHQAGKRRELIEWATIAAELYPKEAKLYADLGDLYALGGEKEKAAAQYKKALALDPSNEAIKKKLKEIKK